MKIEVAISMGELFDKITILQIKKEKITDKSKLENINKELSYLQSKVLNNDPKVGCLVTLLSVVPNTKSPDLATKTL